MGNLLLLIGCSAAEVREQLLPACFVFGLEYTMKTQFMYTTSQNYFANVLLFSFFLSFFSLLVFYNQRAPFQLLQNEDVAAARCLQTLKKAEKVSQAAAGENTVDVGEVELFSELSGIFTF